MLKESPDENGIDFPDQILLVDPLECLHLNIRVPNLVLLNGLPESNTTGLFFSLNQHYKVDTERPLAQQFCRSTRDRDDRAFIVCRTASIYVPVPPR